MRRFSLALLPLFFVVTSCAGAAPPAPPVPSSEGASPPPAAEAVSFDKATGEEPAAVPSEQRAKSPAEGSADKASPPAADPDKDGRPRMGATDFFAYIYKNPKKEGLALGYVRLGTSVPLRSKEPVDGDGCPRGWYPVEPRGYICLEYRTTLDLEDPYYLALKEVAPDPTALWPYSYVYSNGAPMYSRLPTQEEQTSAEKHFGAPGTYVQLAAWSKGHEELLIPEPVVAKDPIPQIFQGKRTIFGGTRNPKKLVWRTIPNGSLLAYSKAFEHEGRVFLVTPDLMLVPADRTRNIRRSTFHGVDLAGDVSLPIAWNRTKATKPKLRRAGEGFEPTGETVAAKTPVEILPDAVTIGKTKYYELRREPGTFLAATDVTVTWPRKDLPSGVQPGQRWVEAKILPGTLTAYEGTTPVRAMLFSPGKGGVPVPGLDHTKYATTAMGYFPVEWKERVATMSNEKHGEPKTLWYSDVPRIQYLKAPLAMHVAYWHEDFGNPKSAECVNIAPMDGQWLFDWSLPHLPEGWGAIRPGAGAGPSTPVIISAQ